MVQTRSVARRHFLAGLGLGCTSSAFAAPTPAQPAKLVIAGPAGGRLDRWASLLAPKIGRSLPFRHALMRQNLGGWDGVTGANQFEARAEPDGNTALLVSGSAITSWIVGEMRAKFDPARWVPLWAATGRVVIVGRSALTRGNQVRLAASGPAGPELPVLLALDLMGIDVVLSQPQDATILVMQGPGADTSIAAASAAGMLPLLTLGVLGSDGELGRDPALPTIPTAFDRIAGKAPADMIAALRATVLAAQIDAGLVLPQLTPASSVALWRNACAPLLQDPDIRNEARRLGVTLVSAATAASCTSGIAGNPGVLLSLRRWLSTRYDWSPA